MSRPGRYLVRQDSTRTVVEVLADGRVRVGGAAPLHVTRVGDGRYLVSDGAEAWRVSVAGPADARFVCTRGASGRLDIEAEGRAPRRRARAGSGETSAPMPATVIEIAVEVGQRVSAGAVLLKLEAMKMELPIRAPRDGTITAIRCAAGDLVQPGVPLVEIG